MNSSAPDPYPHADPQIGAQAARRSSDVPAGGLGALYQGVEPWPEVKHAHTEAMAETFGEVLKPHEILTCVEWMRRHKEPVSEKLWEGTYQIAQHGRSQRTRLIATRMLADRFDPIPRNEPTPERGPVTFNVAIVNGDATPNHPGHAVETDRGSIRAINSDGRGA